MAIVRNLAQNGSFDGVDIPRGVSLRDPGAPTSRYTITPSDSAMLSPFVRGVYVGVAGNISYMDANGVTRTEAFPIGESHVVMLKIFSTGTTATGIQVLL